MGTDTLPIVMPHCKDCPQNTQTLAEWYGKDSKEEGMLFSSPRRCVLREVLARPAGGQEDLHPSEPYRQTLGKRHCSQSLHQALFFQIWGRNP